jgi:hypothetical protein
VRGAVGAKKKKKTRRNRARKTMEAKGVCCEAMDDS